MTCINVFLNSLTQKKKKKKKGNVDSLFVKMHKAIVKYIAKNTLYN